MFSLGAGRMIGDAAAFFITLLLIPRAICSSPPPALSQCLPEIGRPLERHLIYKERVLDIRLETSGRVTHQLTTAVFAIFLREVLGYSNVTITSQPDAFNVTAVLTRISPECQDENHNWDKDDSPIPETMINLEVWVPLGFNIIEQWVNSPDCNRAVEECGSLGPGGRFGWFMPAEFANRAPVKDHWRSLQDLSVAQLFDLDDSELNLTANFTKDPLTQTYYCNTSYCEDGAFYPEVCKSDKENYNPPCAVLFAEYPDYTSFVVEQIITLRLRVKVFWVGPHAYRLVHQLLRDEKRKKLGKSVMFFAWRPSTITEEGNFTTVAFPQCHTSTAADNIMSCAYEFQRFEKVAWEYIKHGAKLVFEALQRLFFTQEDYINLLRLYNGRRNDEGVEQVACRWMQQNQRVWYLWRPSEITSRVSLYIGGIFPLSGLAYSAPGMIPAAQMAVQAVNSNSSILSNYVLELLVSDGKCTSDVVMKSFIDYIRFPFFNRMAGILGPACSDTVEPIAGVSKHFKTVVISYSAEGSSFSDREKFPYFFRTIGENQQFTLVYLKLMRQLKWSRVAALTEEGKKYAEYLSSLQDLLQANDINFVANRKFPRERSTHNMSQYLEELKAKRAKIIIGEFYDDPARAIMCEAYHQNMTARNGYVWFLPTWFTRNWYDTDHFNRNVPRKELAVPCTTQQMIEAINGHLSLTYSNYAPENSTTHEGISVKQWRARYEETCRKFNSSVQPSEYAGYVYDAVWTYAFALDQLLKNNYSHALDFHTEKTTESFTKILGQTDFVGVSGRLQFVGGSSRVSDIHVVQWLDRRTRIVGVFHQFAPDFQNITDGRLDLNESAIVWLTEDGTRPDDGAEEPLTCVLDGLAHFLNVDCEVAIVVANILGFGFFAALLTACFFFFKHRYESKVKQTEERMRALGLLPSGTLIALDEWEIPRERIVINRKLGEGAFGTVYGGEAFFDDRGWVAVAVKTLKVGSAVEEKLDFLTEAEMMKRFSHKNIVRLLGVCTRNEPIYAVMEFMLYGDLKTYLLARRHLVSEKSRDENEEVSSRRLTSMALDVARALSYLAELKYVHRDVACRNCLVNSNRVVKLADFGMTRPMYENDYYRFSRKGMLPVRWMAPESLMDGLFTPMTDIWSYGVLLYEIITFGSFPFQGLSNNQVLEHVRNGSTIEIPEGVKPQLETLLRTCWHRTPSLRPQAAEIVELLTNNPRLIHPCVGIPLASIQIEGTQSLELQLPQFRKHSASQSGNSKFPQTSRFSGFDLSSRSVEPCPVDPSIDPLLTQINPSAATQYVTLQHTAKGDLDYVLREAFPV